MTFFSFYASSTITFSNSVVSCTIEILCISSPCMASEIVPFPSYTTIARASVTSEIPMAAGCRSPKLGSRSCLSVSGRLQRAAAIRPNPPLLLTAEAKRQPLHQTIPPEMIGYFIPKSLQIRFSMSIHFSEIRCKA